MLEVPPGVFHPAFFFSSRTFARFIGRRSLAGRTVVDVGCGSGLLALVAARAGGNVCALDINPDAVRCTRANAARNGLRLATVRSDLFDGVPDRRFDVVVVNPPYFPGDPVDAADHAWRAGAGYSYFERLFAGLARHTTDGADVWMILADNCDMPAIIGKADAAGWGLIEVHTERVLWERQRIWQLRKSAAET